MRTVAGTKPTTKITRFADGHATKMGAYTHHHQPFRLLDSIAVRLGVTETFESISILDNVPARIVE